MIYILETSRAIYRFGHAGTLLYRATRVLRPIHSNILLLPLMIYATFRFTKPRLESYHIDHREGVSFLIEALTCIGVFHSLDAVHSCSTRPRPTRNRRSEKVWLVCSGPMPREIKSAGNVDIFTGPSETSSTETHAWMV
jgi:hypothetical protein